MTTVTTVRAQVRDELVADLTAVGARVLAAVRAEIPAYRSLTGPQTEEVQAIAVWGITRVLDAWVREQQLGADDLRRFRGIGAARAMDGRPLPVVLRAYRVAGGCVTDLIAERALDRLDATDALALARLWMTSIDALSEALYEGHRAAAERLDSDRGAALDDLLSDLLAGRQATRTALAERSRRLGVTLPRHPDLVVARPDPAAQDGPPEVEATRAQWHRLVQVALEESATPQEGQHLHAVVDGLAVAVLPDGVAGHLSGRLAPAGWHGVVLHRARLAELARAHRLAAHVLRQAPARAFGARALLDDLDAAVVAALSGCPDRLEAPHVLLRELLGSHEKVTEGLVSLLATGNAVAAAQRLGCHPQTMRYRLRRLRELTGRDVADPWDRFVLDAASVGGQGDAHDEHPGSTVGPHERV